MESKRTCCSPTVFCGMRVESMCFIFAIINAIITSLAVLCSLAFLIFVIYMWVSGFYDDDIALAYMFLAIALACCIATSLDFTFAVVLCKGVRNSIKGYLRMYLVYGISKVTLGTLWTIGFVVRNWGKWEIVMEGAAPLGGLMIYCSMLMLVYKTYKVFLYRSRDTDGLLDKYDC